jgi:3D (Asp-Asp-Asp) domain-containing protein
MVPIAPVSSEPIFEPILLEEPIRLPVKVERKAETIAPSRSESKNLNWQIFEVTAYTLSLKECGKPPGHPNYGRTKSGKMAQVGVTVAAGPEIPLGTRIIIPDLAWLNGTGEFIVQDRGPLVTKGCIDVYFGDPEKDPGVVARAKKFGRQNIKGAVID